MGGADAGRSSLGGGASPAALRAIVDGSEEGMLLADGRGIITYANRAAERLLGAAPGGLPGRSGFDFCRPEHVPHAREEFARCLADPRVPVVVNVDVRRGEDEFRPVSARLVNGLDDAGLRAIIVYFHEVGEAPTDARAAEPRDEPYRLLFAHALVGLGVADLQGNLLAFNDAMLAPGGYTREDIEHIGNVARLYASAADRERILAIARERGRVWREEVRFLRKDGTPYDTLLTLTPMVFEGRPCWYATVEDITAQKRAEAERVQLEARLRQAQKMEAVGRMTSGIAHDFNNALSVILANAGLMATALPRESPELRRGLDELQAAATRGAAMIQKLLGFSRNAPLNIEPTDLATLVRRLEGALRLLLPDRITLTMSADREVIASVDPAAIEQVLMNLVSNARDAIDADGHVRIAVAQVTVRTLDQSTHAWMLPGEYAHLSVADDGTGMDEETRANAFEPFFTTKPVGIGTGLGLSMVYGLVKQQQGFIDLETAPGRGTVAHLYLPLAPAAASEEGVARRATRELPGGSETILLIEDDDPLRDTARRVLERLGYRVLLAPDGHTGVSLFRLHRREVDLVISDIQMPGLTGPDVWQAIRREQPDARFMFSSGYRESDAIGATLPPGVSVLRKPWTIEEIARAVRELLDRP